MERKYKNYILNQTWLKLTNIEPDMRNISFVQQDIFCNVSIIVKEGFALSAGIRWTGKSLVQGTRLKS